MGRYKGAQAWDGDGWCGTECADHGIYTQVTNTYEPTYEDNDRALREFREEKNPQHQARIMEALSIAKQAVAQSEQKKEHAQASSERAKTAVQRIKQKMADGFFDAVITGDIKTVQKFLSFGKDIVFVLRQSVTVLNQNPALLLAASKGHLDIVKLLINANFDVLKTNARRESALHWAALHGHTDIVNFLIESGASVNQKNKWHETALHWAAKHGDEALIKTLYRHQADITVKNADGNRPIDVAKNLSATSHALLMPMADLELCKVASFI